MNINRVNKFVYGSFYVSFVLVLVLFSACEKDKSLDKSDVNGWIYETMKKNYYWNDEIPESGNTNAGADPETFFKSLLSTKDGKAHNGGHYYYSTIEEDVATKSGNIEMTYGFKPAYRYLDENSTDVYMGIKYVIPDSPAEKAGLARGDWVSHYNGTRLTTSNYLDFHNYKESMTLIVGKITRSGLIDTRSVTLDAAIQMAENPILVDTTYLEHNRKIAYLVYNSFTSGPEDNSDITYDNELRSVFAKFAGQSADELILDLRYNPGGLLSCAQLLATMIAPQNALDKNFCTLTYNKTVNKTVDYTLDKSIIANGANLNLNRLFIITSTETASSSELIINGLRPYMNVILIGDLTEGKNVGSNEYSGNPDHPWILHPITCLVENSEGFSDYSAGFTPDHEVADAFNSTLGNTEEYMLSNTLSVIETGSLLSTLRSAGSEKMKTLPLPRKGSQAIVID